jgi:hypothetical protein
MSVDKDLQISELLAEIQILKSKLEQQTIHSDISLDEISIDNNEITETASFKLMNENNTQPNDDMNVMNLLNMFMGGSDKNDANPMMNMMQQMMMNEEQDDSEDDANPLMDMVQKMMSNLCDDSDDAKSDDAKSDDANTDDAKTDDIVI